MRVLTIIIVIILCMVAVQVVVVVVYIAAKRYYHHHYVSQKMQFDRLQRLATFIPAASTKVQRLKKQVQDYTAARQNRV